ncbi:hypothetical protein Moror_8385 [Moniliophthora roreri MCA 2997]|uniref:Zn(2)-C6 fungal-type domain-containing protein n=2 Tax=Moniliophthora roreri TaxID=221103 RepID=V2XNU9_MONRO|nr:hypothetical protein Moror_8385 [Moniliophthora roreri MCA 2997]
MASSKSKSKQKLTACSNCRRLKTRCELLDLQSPVRCHRCKKVKVACSYSEMDEIVFLQPQERPKSTEEIYLTFARAFRDLQAFSLDYSNTPYTWIMDSRNIAVDALPQRVVDWFGWFNGSTVVNGHGLDWSYPLVSIANLQPCYSFVDLDGPLFLPEDALQNIIPINQVQELLEIYQQKYGG